MQKKQELDKAEEDLNKALEEFENETPLNLTDEADKGGDEDPELAKKIQEQYEKFMSEMKNFQMGGEEGFDDLAGSLGGLLKGLTQSLGVEGKEGEELKNLFQGNNGEGNIQDIAGKLLEVFMNKDLLYAPLVECKANYDDYFKKQQGKIPEQDLPRYKQQYAIICEIIDILDKQPTNKQKLMELFEKMQDHGQPPAGIASVTLPGGI